MKIAERVRPSRLFQATLLAFGVFSSVGCQSRADVARASAPPFLMAPSDLRLAKLSAIDSRLGIETEVPMIQSDVFAEEARSKPSETPVRMWTDWDGEPVAGYLRSQRALETRLPVVKELFAAANVPFPPAELSFVAYKSEKLIEVWGAAEKGGKASKIATYGICAASGTLGPKRFEGDHQVPEGYYVLSYGWAESNYHLEMKVSYPNMVDKVLGPKNKSLGGEIMIHGACASIGCMAMGDERAEELWVMMKAMGDANVKVAIYPSRDMDSLLGDPEYQAHHSFWRNLKEGKDLFEKTHQIPIVKADWHGVYLYNQ